MRAIAVCVFACAAVGCAPEFDRQSEVSTVRVLGVQKDPAYPAPGETVTLTMLDHDGSGEDRSLSHLWIAGCLNPPGDLYAGCLAEFAAAGSDVISGEKFAVGTEQQFSFDVPEAEEVFAGRPPPLDGSPRYGIAYVFFAVCAGTIGIGPEPEVFPIACYGDDGELLDADDFVVGYTSFFVYEGFRNDNPEISALEFEVNGERVTPDCVGAACLDLPSEPTVDPCAIGAAPCVEACEKEEEETCPDIPVRPIVDPASAELDSVLEAAGQGELLEQMWINYYVDGGSVTSEVRLLNDALKGWNDDYGTDYHAPPEPGPQLLWAVAHDNRGGTQWVRVTIGVRKP